LTLLESFLDRARDAMCEHCHVTACDCDGLEDPRCVRREQWEIIEGELDQVASRCMSPWGINGVGVDD
jgi:hypothetical protein